MREAGMETWKTIKEYADLMFREEEIVPLEGSFGGLLEEGEQVFLESSRVTLYKQPKYPKLKKIDDGKLLLTDRGLVFMKNRDGRGMRFRFNDIVGESTEKNYIFQIALKPDLEKPGDEGIRRFEMKHESCLKWELLFNHVQDRSRTARE
jgi:hypothetical protein